MQLTRDEIITFPTGHPDYVGTCQLRIFTGETAPPVIIVTGIQESVGWIQSHCARIATTVWHDLGRPAHYRYIEHAPYLPGHPLIQVLFAELDDQLYEGDRRWPINIVELLGPLVPDDVLEAHEKWASRAVSSI